MEVLSRKYARDLYLPELQMLVDYGEKVDVRGRETKEILNFVSEVQEPWHHCILIPSRRWNPWLALSEALWILAGRNDVAALAPYNSNIVNYSDDGIHLYGAYGARLYDQIDDLIGRLRRDPSDRRAVLSIWNNSGSEIAQTTYSRHPVLAWDLTTDSKDPPCNDMVFFKLREGRLHMTVLNRSNDIHWGLFAVNIPTFGILQEYIAARLGVGMGTQTHLSNSLHVYTDDKRAVEITDRMLYQESEDLPKYPEHALMFEDLSNFKSHKDFAKMCSSVLDGEVVTSRSYPDFLAFAHYFLEGYKEHEIPPGGGVYADWKMAGRLFANKVWKKEAVS